MSLPRPVVAVVFDMDGVLFDTETQYEKAAIAAAREVGIRIFRELTETQEILKPGVRELLDLLDELRLPRAVATSSTRVTVERHLQRHALADRFHGIAAHGDYARHKPHPDPFLKAAELLASIRAPASRSGIPITASARRRRPA